MATVTIGSSISAQGLLVRERGDMATVDIGNGILITGRRVRS